MMKAADDELAQAKEAARQTFADAENEIYNRFHP